MRGHIHKRVRKNRAGKETTLWYVVVDVGVKANGKRQQKWHGGFPTRREAEAARAKIVTDLHAGSYIAPDRISLAEWVTNSWLPMIESRIKPSTLHSYRRNMALHVLPALGTRPLQQLTAAMLNALYASLLAGANGRGPLSPKTVSYIHATVHKALADAVNAGVVPRNVAERAKAPRPNRRARTEIRCWESEELARFLDHVRGTRLKVAWRLAAMTGMRRGEVLGLRWRDVDLDAARISVRNAIVSVGYEVLESTPKTHQARVIDLDPETVEILGRHQGRQRVDRERLGKDYVGGGDLVVAKEDGEPIHPHSFSQAFDRLVRTAGLRRIRLHDLRHSHATIAVKAGIPLKVISERLGHESPAFTLKQYAHVMPGMQADAACTFARVVDGDLEGRSRAKRKPESTRPVSRSRPRAAVQSPAGPQPTLPDMAAEPAPIDSELAVPEPAYCTESGTMYLSSIEDFLGSPYASAVRGHVSLIFTSPPFPLNRKKKYGNRVGEEYLEWLGELAEPLGDLLTEDGSFVMELGNAWEKGEPVMSTLALKAMLQVLESGGFHLCQQFVVHNPARLPSPAQWVNVERIRVKDAYTNVWWMARTPRPKADNRRILSGYSPAMQKLLRRQSYNAGGRPSQHSIGQRSFLTDHGGAIPPNALNSGSFANWLTISNTVSTDDYRAYCKKRTLKLHPARMQPELAEFFIRFLTEEGDLVLDPFGGSNTTGAVAEALTRQWLAVEPDEDYIAGSKGRFDAAAILTE